MSGNPSVGRKPLMAANWKMNKVAKEAEAFAKDFLPEAKKWTDQVDVVVCPPFTALAAVFAALSGDSVKIGGQNVNENKSGAFTGEISGSMLKAAGCQFVIIGHSERRQYYGETDELVNKKIKATFEADLIPIVCVGETLEEREANKTLTVVQRQVLSGLKGLPSSQLQKLVLAYEPIWAIGTGKTATAAQAQEVHLTIRDILKDQWGSMNSLAVRILYGGSVKPDNIATLMACEDIDGALVGGASLEAKSFVEIVSYKNHKIKS